MLSIKIPAENSGSSEFKVIDETEVRISTKAHVYGSQQITLKKKVVIMNDVMLRGDLGLICIDFCSYIGPRSIIRPRMKLLGNDTFSLESKIGRYVIIREDCIVEAAEIGNHVYVGQNSILGNNCVLKECVYVMPGSVIPAETVVPPFAVMEGNPAKNVGQLPMLFHEMMKEALLSESMGTIST
ncbi:hypothetical protein M3Y97_00295500 [Aphelenchoides bicaudatus]|nr:hypothetical protein M3Y97_00295500 [Aphelenchoides bicaudatus]